MADWHSKVERSLRIRFTKSLRHGWATNIILDPDCVEILDALDADEKCVVRVDCRDGVACYFTPSRLLVRRPDSVQLINYNSITKCSWITPEKQPASVEEQQKMKRRLRKRGGGSLSDRKGVCKKWES